MDAQIQLSTASSDRRVLRADEITLDGSTLDVLTELRPEYLRPHAGLKGLSEPVLPVAYLDGAMLPELALLRQVPIAWVAEVRYVEPSATLRRFGRHHEGGAIMVISKGTRH